MKKETWAEKLARKSFEGAAIQKSWKMHLQAFGPILESAFVDDYQSRIHLTAALNFISNRDVKSGYNKLQALESACVTDADKAAWLFCMGLCFEMAGMKEQMLGCYQEAAEYQHKFYLPYLKVAKSAHDDGVFEVAEENYIQAIQCLKMSELNEQASVILGSAYTNYASCLTMMHRYEEAEEMLNCSEEVLPEQRGRYAAEAILAAAKGDVDEAYGLEILVKNQTPELAEMTSKMVTEILESKHPHFAQVPLKDGCVDEFWNWFLESENILLEKLGKEEYDIVFQMIQLKLKKMFPFMERDLELGIEPIDERYKIIFADFYMVSLECGYKALLETVPEVLSEHWSFETAH